MTELIIAEKPSAAKKVAKGLSKSATEHKEKGVRYYTLINDEGEEVFVASAVGHIFTLEEKEKSFNYPTFDIEWVPSYEANKDAKFTKQYYNILKKLSKKATEYTVACDFDVEGEVIGYNVIRFICKQDDAQRMKFSTLVPEDVKSAYTKKGSSIEWGQAKAGETRHKLDWMYGINISRALTKAMKKAGRFTLMSSGRVQGPALKIIADKERKIQAFEPTPYWVVTAMLQHDQSFTVSYEKGKLWKEKKAEKVVKESNKADTAEVIDVDKRVWTQKPPTPFNLGGLQSEAYKTIGLSPKQSLQIAQDLYTKGVTSYPRTSSQKLPKNIGYKKIFSKLKKNTPYKALIEELTKGTLKPNNGKKKDPAHPAIYPTGEPAKGLKGKEKKVYDLIVKRFMATFGPNAKRQTTKLTFDINTYKYNAKATKTVEEGWHRYYKPFVRYKEQDIASVKEGEKIGFDKASYEEKETQPPRRYTKASLVKELEKQGLGTKATRADIVENLYKRGYADGKSITVSDLGLKLSATLEEHIPDIVSPDLTKHFEQKMEGIREKKEDPETTLSEAKETLIKILDEFKGKEKEIGEELLDSHQKMMKEKNTLGTCPECGEGDLMIRKGKYGKFAACNEYPDCKTTFSLPKKAKIIPTDDVSDTGHPMIKVIKKGKKPQVISINPDDNMSGDAKKLIEKVESGDIEIVDEDSGSKMVVRSGPYGKFLGAEDYPKVKKIMDPEELVEEYKDKLE